MKEQAITRGIEVNVESFFLPEQSNLDQGQYVFAYRVQLKNRSDQTVQLISRHWIITDAEGHVNEVKGEGVVGEQPTLKPGEDYEYMSGSHLNSEVGTMEGSYQMESETGEHFDIKIPCFTLAPPHAVN